jgi:hypothetical protein
LDFVSSADLGLDPFRGGVRVGALGTRGFRFSEASRAPFVRRLARAYGRAHEVVLYEASHRAGRPARLERRRVYALASAEINTATTLHVPPRTWARSLTQ